MMYDEIIIPASYLPRIVVKLETYDLKNPDLSEFRLLCLLQKLILAAGINVTPLSCWLWWHPTYLFGTRFYGGVCVTDFS